MMAQAKEAVQKAADAIPEAITKAIPTSPPPQRQDVQPGVETEMTPKPVIIRDGYIGASKLKGKVAIITGGDSGIGRSVAVHFAREGAAAIAILYLDEHEDAKETQRMVEAEGSKCAIFPGNVQSPDVCASVVSQVVEKFGRIDILINNAAVQHYRESLDEISPSQLEETFKTNIFGYIYMAQNALKHMGDEGAIINTTSVTAYQGMTSLVDYASTKGAIVAFTRSLSQQLLQKGKKIRVNAVAPGPIWTPLIPATFPKTHVAGFGSSQTPMQRMGQPSEVAPCFVFLASEDASYMAGQVLHPNGGVIVNS